MTTIVEHLPLTYRFLAFGDGGEHKGVLTSTYYAEWDERRGAYRWVISDVDEWTPYGAAHLGAQLVKYALRETGADSYLARTP